MCIRDSADAVRSTARPECTQPRPARNRSASPDGYAEMCIRDRGCSNQAVSVDKYPLVVSLRYLSDSNSTRVQIFATCILFCFAIVAILYWYFGTEQGHAIDVYKRQILIRSWLVRIPSTAIPVRSYSERTISSSTTIRAPVFTFPIS